MHLICNLWASLHIWKYTYKPLVCSSVPPLVHVYFLNTDFIWLVSYSPSYSTCFYSVVLIRNDKKLINIYIFNLTKDDILLIKLEKCHYKGKKKSLLITLRSQISPRNGKVNFWSEFFIIDLKVLLNWFEGAPKKRSKRRALDCPCKVGIAPLYRNSLCIAGIVGYSSRFRT